MKIIAIDSGVIKFMKDLWGTVVRILEKMLKVYGMFPNVK